MAYFPQVVCVGWWRVSFKYHGKFCISLGNMAIFLTEGLLDLGATSRQYGVGGRTPSYTELAGFFNKIQNFAIEPINAIYIAI